MALKTYFCHKLRSQDFRYSKLGNCLYTAIDYAEFRSRSFDAVIRIFDEGGNVIDDS